MKRVLSLVLVLTLVLGSFSFAFAASPSDVAGTEYEAAVNKLISLGIVDGYPDGTFKPNNPITRAEMAKLVIVALGLEGVAEFATNLSVFSDMDNNWAKKFVNVAESKGIIKGFPDGTFGPSKEITYAEAITFLVRALGYEDARMGGTWPINYITKAEELGITKDITVKAGSATRGDVALMLDATLSNVMVSYDRDGLVVVDADGNIKGDKLVSKVAKLEKYDVLDVKDDAIVVDKDGKEVKTLVDMSEYLFENVNVYVKDKAVVLVDGVNTKNYEGTAAVEGNKLTVTDANKKSKEFTVKNDDLVRYNGVDTEFSKVNLKDAKVKVVYTEKDKEVTVARLVATEKVAYKVVSVDFDLDKVKLAKSFDGITLPTKTENKKTVVDFDKVVVTGDVEDIEDIKENDVIYVYVGKNAKGELAKVTIDVVRDTVTGEVTKAKSNTSGKLTTLELDGVEYTAVAGAVDASVANVGGLNTLILDASGKIVKVIPAADATTTGYVTEVESYTVLVNGKAKTVNDVTILTTDGEKTYRVADKVTTPAEKDFVKVTLNTDDEVKSFDKLDKDSDLTTATVADKAVNTKDSTIKLGDSTYLVDSRTIIFNKVTEEYAKLEDVKAGMGIKYLVSGLRVARIFITEGTSLDAVTGIYVGQYSMRTADGTVHYVTLNVKGEEVDYVVEAKIDTDIAKGRLVKLSDATGVKGKLDTLAVTGDVRTATANIDLDTGKLETNAGKYLVTNTTIIYVIDKDGVATIGTINDIEKDSSLSIVASSTVIAGYTKADIVVVNYETLE